MKDFKNTAQLDEEIKELTTLIEKHGICIDCGEMFSHDIDAPFAYCKCSGVATEWTIPFTPYMELEKVIYDMENNSCIEL